MVTQVQNAIDTFLDYIALYEADRVFNPWAKNCELVDVEDSYYIRRSNLRAVLCACSAADEVDVWIGRDLGWRGGRRTGIALVDESSLNEYAQSINVLGLKKATVGPVMRERTATEIHIARARVSRKVFFWNVFPFHPHEADKSHSNRMHTPSERDVGLSILQMVLSLLPINRLVAIGNDATNALNAAKVTCCPVRHPSYGGQKDFHRQINSHYGLSRAMDAQIDLF